MKNSIKLLLITTMLIPASFMGAQTATPLQRENSAKTWQFPVQDCKERMDSLVNGVRTGVRVGKNHTKAFASNLKKKTSAILVEIKNHKKSVAAGTVVVAALLIALDNMVNRNKGDMTYGRRFSLWLFNIRAFGEPVENNQEDFSRAPKSSIFMKDMPKGYFDAKEGQVVAASAVSAPVVNEPYQPHDLLLEELKPRLKKRRALLMGTYKKSKK